MPRAVKLSSKRLYGVYLQTIMNVSGTFKYKSATGLRRALRLPPTGRLALFLTATDKLIEKAWEFSDLRNVWERIASYEFEFVTSATYSVYQDDPRSDQIYNQERNFRTQDIFCELGLPSIPFLFFNPDSSRDFDSVIKWLRERGDISKVAILAQCYRHRGSFQRLLVETQTLVNAIERSLQFIFVGVAKLHKIRRIITQYPNAMFASVQPVLKAMKGELTLNGLEHRSISLDEATSATLITRNIMEFDRQIAFERNRISMNECPTQLLLPFGNRTVSWNLSETFKGKDRVFGATTI
jgi:hypothetical protein